MNDQDSESVLARYCGGTTPRDRRNQMRYTALLFGWAVVFCGAAYVIKADPPPPDWIGWMVAAVASTAALFPALAYRRFLREADELARVIELKALALAVCAGFVAWPAWQVALWLGLASVEWPSVPLLVMIAFYSIGTVRSWKHYR